VSFSYDNIISNIAYGSFVSSQFCCGGWSFISAAGLRYRSKKIASQYNIKGADVGSS
jgi:hypothetical protein